MNNPALHQHAQNEAYSRSFDERCRLLELRRQQAHEQGIPALKQLWQVAQGDSGRVFGEAWAWLCFLTGFGSRGGAKVH